MPHISFHHDPGNSDYLRIAPDLRHSNLYNQHHISSKQIIHDMSL